MEISGKAGMGIIAAIVVIIVVAGAYMMKRSDPTTQMSPEAQKNFEMYQKSGSAGMPGGAGTKAP